MGQNNKNEPKITAKMLDNLLSSTFSEGNYPKDREGIRKFSIETRDAIGNSEQCLLSIATIIAKNMHDPEGAVLTAFAAGIVLGYRLKETQIEKIIDEIDPDSPEFKQQKYR